MSSSRIRIVVTDNERTFTMGFIQVAENQRVVFGQVTPDSSSDAFHITYHKNGYTHQKWFPNTDHTRTDPLYYGPSIENFRGFLSPVQMPIPQGGKVVSPDFEDEEDGYDNITHIDTRKTEHSMNYKIFVSEPGFPLSEIAANAEKIANKDSPGLAYQVYTGTNPWVGVIYWPQATGIRIPNSTENFRPMGEPSLIRNAKESSEACINGKEGCDGLDGTGPLCMECYEMVDN